MLRKLFSSLGIVVLVLATTAPIALYAQQQIFLPAVQVGETQESGIEPDSRVHKVTICHRTNSVTNPYVMIEVDSDSVDIDTGNDHGQGDHNAEHTGPVWDRDTVYPPPHNGDQWGDIIPPFYTDSSAGYWPSLNWNSAGMEIFYNNCNPVIPTPTATVTETATPSPSPTSTNSPEPSPTPTGTATATATPTGTQSPSPTPTSSPVPSNTPTPTDVVDPSPTPTDVPTGKPVVTTQPTEIPTDKPTSTPTPTFTSTPTVVPTETPTASPSPSPTPTSTSSPSPSPTATMAPGNIWMPGVYNDDPTPTVEPMPSQYLVCQIFGDPYIYGSFVTLTGNEEPHWMPHLPPSDPLVSHPIWGEGWHMVLGVELYITELKVNGVRGEIITDLIPNEDGAMLENGTYVFNRLSSTGWGEEYHVVIWVPIHGALAADGNPAEVCESMLES